MKIHWGIGRNICWLAVLIFVAGYAQVVNRDFAVDPFYSVYFDTTNLYALQRLVDPGLFGHDPLAMNLTRHVSFFNPGFAFFPVYQLLLRFCSLPVAEKIVSAILCVLSTFLIRYSSSKIFTRSWALFCSGLFLVYFLSMDSFFSGMARSFGAFLYILFIVLLSEKRWLAAIMCLWITTFFYMSILPGMFLTYLFVFFSLKRPSLGWRRCSLYGLLLLLALIIGAVMFSHSALGTVLLTKLKGFETYKFYMEKDPLDIKNPLVIVADFIFNLNEHSSLYVYCTVFLCLLNGGLFLFRRDFRLPPLLWQILLAAGCSFLIIFPIHPVSASRQFIFAMPLFLVLSTAFSLNKVIGDRMRPGVWLTILFLVFLTAHPFLNDISSCARYKPVYDYIGLLPKDILIAGSPKSQVLRTIPFFAKRPVYYVGKFYDIWLFFSSPEFVRQRQEREVQAVYADSIEFLKNFMEHEHVDYFIVEERYYQPSGMGELMHAYNKSDEYFFPYIQKRMAEKRFALLDFARETHDYAVRVGDEQIYIVSADTIARGAGSRFSGK